jgi:hypothetical protein
VKMTREEMEACCKKAKVVKYLVAGRTFDKREDALKARDEAQKAVKSIHLTFLVDGKEVGCSTQVCPKAKAAGKVKYVLNKEQMDCEYQARVAVSRAKFDAARSVAEKLAKA